MDIIVLCIKLNMIQYDLIWSRQRNKIIVTEMWLVMLLFEA